MSEEIDTSIPTEGDAAPAAEAPTFSMYGENGLHEGLKAHIGENKAAGAFFSKYAGAADPNAEVMKGIENLSYMASQKAREKPADDAPDSVKEEWQTFIKGINGTPDAAEAYGFNERPEGLDESIPYDLEVAGKYADVLHKHNASPELAKELLAINHEELASIPDQIANQQAAHKEQVMETLRNTVGIDADQTIGNANKAANLLGWSPEVIAHMGSDAETVLRVSELMQKISPDIMSGGNSANGMSSGESSSNFEAKAIEAGRLAMEAMQKGDNAAYDRHVGEQRHWNQQHINASR